MSFGSCLIDQLFSLIFYGKLQRKSNSNVLSSVEKIWYDQIHQKFLLFDFFRHLVFKTKSAGVLFWDSHSAGCLCDLGENVINCMWYLLTAIFLSINFNQEMSYHVSFKLWTLFSSMWQIHQSHEVKCSCYGFVGSQLCLFYRLWLSFILSVYIWSNIEDKSPLKKIRTSKIQECWIFV